MQSLGENTIADFLKIDSFQTGETSKADKSVNNTNLTTNLSRVNQEESDLGRYFKDSLVSFSKNGDKSPKRAPKSPRTPKKPPRSPRTPKKSPRSPKKLLRNRPALDIIIQSKNTTKTSNQNEKSEKNYVEDELNSSLELTKSFRSFKSQGNLHHPESNVKFKKIPSAGALSATSRQKLNKKGEFPTFENQEICTEGVNQTAKSKAATTLTSKTRILPSKHSTLLRTSPTTIKPSSTIEEIERNDISDESNASLELTKSSRSFKSLKNLHRTGSNVKIKNIPSAGVISASSSKKLEEIEECFVSKVQETSEDVVISGNNSKPTVITTSPTSILLDKPSTSTKTSPTTLKPTSRTSPIPILNLPGTKSNAELSRPIDVSSDIELSCRSDQNLSSQISIEIPSIINSQDCKKLAYWGLPLTILRKYESRGVIEMFPWQVECLRNPAIMEKCKNLVYSAPTSAGKTLVSEILIIKTILERKKKVIFVLPFVSVVREKMYYFQDLFSDAGVRVEGFMGGVQPPGGFNATDVAIATIEKANSLVNQLMEEGGIENLGAVVIDELHLLGDSHRGYLLELLLAKLKYMTLKNEHVNIQLIGMSATLPNLHILADWLSAELYKTDFRPVPLKELCKIGSTIYDTKLNQIRELNASSELPSDPEHILQLCLETILDSHSILIFCPSKNWCESLAQQISSSFCKLGNDDKPLGQSLRNQLSKDAIIEILEQLKRTPVGLDKVLRNTVSFGVAFHHAGLTMDERDVIEGAFRSGALRVLTATSTLSSGVNLPARRVIVRTPKFHGQPIDTLTYKQMIGRAGRMGKDTAGESILMCKHNEKNTAINILKSDLKPIESCLQGSSPLIRALLEAVASEVAYTIDDITTYMKCTLLNFTNGSEHIENSTKEAIDFLVGNELLLFQSSGERMNRWIATQLGKACLAASVPPADGLFLFEELQKARRCFVLDTELHVIYIVTPFNSASQIGQIDWYTYLELWKNISESEQRVGQLVGVNEGFLVSALKRDPKPSKNLNIHKRFFTALALHDLVREVPLQIVCQKYQCSRGIIQGLQQTASTFAGMVTQFCKKLGWNCIELLVSQFQQRLQFGVCRELLDLLRLPMLNGLRARSLFKEGITTVAELAVANELDVERALYKALPFESEKEQAGEHENDALRRNQMRTVFVTGRDGLTPREAAKILVKEARALVQNELGLDDLQWEKRQRSQTDSRIEASQGYVGTPLSETRVSVHYNISQHVNKSTKNGSIYLEVPRSGNSSKMLDKEVENVEDVKVNLEANVIENNSEIKNNSSNDRLDKNISSGLSGLSGLSVNSNGILDVASTDITVMLNADNAVFETESTNFNAEVADENEIVQVLSEKIYEEETAIDDDDEVFEEEPKLCIDTRASPSGSALASAAAEINDNIEEEDEEELFDADEGINSLNQGKVNRTRSTSALVPDPDSVAKKNIVDDNENGFVVPSTQTKSKKSLTPSPNIFDDSLNLDSQELNILEKNIVDLDSVTFNESEFSINAPPKSNGSQEIVGPNSGKKIAEVKEKILVTSKASDKINQCKVVRQPGNASQSIITKSVIWEEDTWNHTKLIQSQNINIIANKKPANAQAEILKKASEKNCFESPKAGPANISGRKSDFTPPIAKRRSSESNILQKISERRFSSPSATKSPIASLITYDKVRKMSSGSNKSEDDVIVGSQTADTTGPFKKTRARMRVESLKTRTQKTLVEKSVLPAEQSPDIQVVKIQKSRASAIGVKRRFSSGDCMSSSSKFICDDCTQSVILSSDDEGVPAKRRNILSTTRSRLLSLRTQAKTTVSISDIDAKMMLQELSIVNISDKLNFAEFKQQIAGRKEISMALGCETFSLDTGTIGTRIMGSSSTLAVKKASKKAESGVYNDKKLCGVAMSWGRKVYYLPFENTKETDKIPVKDRIQLLTDILTSSEIKIRCFNYKEIYKTLYKCCGLSPSCKFLDSSTANWLLDPDKPDKNFTNLIAEFVPDGYQLLQKVGPLYSSSGPGMNIRNSSPSDTRCCTEALLSWYLLDAFGRKLDEKDPALLHAFKDIEMSAISIIARMELSGLGVNLTALQELSEVIQQQLASLQEKAFNLAGKKFNFSSSRSVAEVLKLKAGKKVSTSKAVLEQSDHPIAQLVISWRKLSTTFTKIVCPLLSSAERSSRIHGTCCMNTATGRISMFDPNLQGVPRDFEVADKSFTISIRMAFIPAAGNVLIAADYCQLELRILAHFSKEQTLISIFKKPGDVFKSIAARWYNKSEAQIDDKMRQRAKQLIYGMIYGMGVKSLAETLQVEESEAKEFQDTFMGAYPGLKKWINNTLERARQSGFVRTLMKRRRILPGLNSEIAGEKGQAERQAINTKIQGSAADIAKKAMIVIDEKMRAEFSTMPMVFPNEPVKRKLRRSRDILPRGAYLVLQLHDELLYEVNGADLDIVARIVKDSMEQACTLSVPLPVKVKSGPAWGDLTDYNFN